MLEDGTASKYIFYKINVFTGDSKLPPRLHFFDCIYFNYELAYQGSIRRVSKYQNEKPCDNLDLYFPVRQIFEGSGMWDKVN